MSVSLDDKISAFFISELSENITSENNIFHIIEELKGEINCIKSAISNNSTPDGSKSDYNFMEINNTLDILINTIKSNNIQYESTQRKNEQKIRILYGKLFNLKLINEILENKITVLKNKEKEYDLLKQKTGAIVCNGQVICNERKDNEIIILRTENSLLKSAIKNNEDLMKEKNEMINSLNNDIILYKSQIDELRKIKHGKYSSFSNINININEPKKDYSQKNIKENNQNSFMNTIHVFSSKKKINKNQNLNNNSNSKNNLNNIYSSYQMNSQLINKVNNIKNNNKFNNNKEEISQNGNQSKNKKIYVDPLNNKTYFIKYISVNKSLFSPKNNNHQKIGFNNNNDDKKTLQINRIKKSKYLLNNEFVNREYSTITIGPSIKNDVKVKKIFSNRKIMINHKKSNSIQWPFSSIKKYVKTDKSLSIENTSNSQIYSAMKEFNKIKSKTMKNSNKSPISGANTISEGFIKQSHVNKNFHNFLFPYADKKSDNKGRNENNVKMVNDYMKENSISFLHRNYMSSCDNFSKNNKSVNIAYNNSQDRSRDNKK